MIAFGEKEMTGGWWVCSFCFCNNSHGPILPLNYEHAYNSDKYKNSQKCCVAKKLKLRDEGYSGAHSFQSMIASIVNIWRDYKGNLD